MSVFSARFQAVTYDDFEGLLSQAELTFYLPCRHMDITRSPKAWQENVADWRVYVSLDFDFLLSLEYVEREAFYAKSFSIWLGVVGLTTRYTTWAPAF